MTAKDILDTILGYLGFACEIQEQERDGTTVLEIFTSDAKHLIGRRGETLEGLQFLVNRILFSIDRESPKVVVDVEHYRTMKDDSVIDRARHLVAAVINSGQPMQTEPLNSYDRRLIHNAFKDDPKVTTWSPPDDARVKRITIRLRSS